MIRRHAVLAAVALASACSGAAGPAGRSAGEDGDPRPVLDPAPPPPDARCDGPPLPPLSTRSDLIERPARRARPLIVYEWAGREEANLGIGHFRPRRMEGARVHDGLLGESP